MKKQKVLLLYPHYWPFFNAGGPVQSIFNIAATFKDRCDFFVVALNREINAREDDKGITVNKWQEGPNKEQIYFARKISFGLIRRIIREIDPHILFINGVFSAETTIPGLFWGRVLKKKMIVSPRGMLQPWALQRNSLIKKLYLGFLSTLLTRSVQWHATDETEKADIERVFGKGFPIHIASNIPRRVHPFNQLRLPSNKEKINLVFLSLINPNKNLHLVINAVLSCCSRLTLDIFGPVIDKNYWQMCLDRIGKSDCIQYKGPIPPWEVPALLSAYHFLVLPTQGENFGHAIFDGLASGVPVIISRNTTPWADIEEKNAGFYIDLDVPDSLGKKLEMILKLDQSTYSQLRHDSHDYARNYWISKDYEAEYAFLLNDK